MLHERLGLKVNPAVFFTSAGAIVLFVALGALFPAATGEVFASIQRFIVDTFGWFYIAAVAVFLAFVIWLLVGPYGSLRLGPDDAEPEYGYASWFAMLFSAGMGIGLLFYSVAEPILHFAEPPTGAGGTVAAAREAMHLTFFHWGLHAWAIYIVVGLSLAWFTFRRGLSLRIRSAFYPIFGERIRGPVGDAIDIFAVLGTMFGIATSLGLGVMQINAGLDHLGVIEVSTSGQLLLIALITAVATASVVSGLDGGIKRLSELNLILGLGLLLLVFAAGPTLFLLRSLVESVGRYFQHLVGTTFRTHAFEGTDWQASWTTFYWAWWIAWSPFVGMFIARISRGRTIREFVGGVLLVPTLLTFVWLVVFGNTALHLELFGGGGIVEAVKSNLPVALYEVLERLPFTQVTAVLATVVIGTYFVTSSDSGSLVIDILTSDGDLDPPVRQRIFWALTEGAVAAVLLVTGGLKALQTAAITTALPFTALMLLMCWSLARDLRAHARPLPRAVVERPRPAGARAARSDRPSGVPMPPAGEPAAD